MAKLYRLSKRLSPAKLREINAEWPSPQWIGWHRYDPEEQAKWASNLTTPIPLPAALALAMMANLDAGYILEIGKAIPDLSLWGGGLHAMPSGGFLAPHRDADTHPRLGLARAYSAVLYVHEEWRPEWGGELAIEGHAPITPEPGMLVVFDCREAIHEVLPIRCPPGVERRSLALFGYLPEPGPGNRPRAEFYQEKAA